MFFVASKAFWLLMQPISVVLLLILAGLASVLLQRRKSAIVLIAVAALVQGLLGFTSFGYVLIQPLEDRFAAPETLAGEVGTIVMLGGATMARPSTARQIAELNQGGDRLTTTLWLAQRYPQARIVLSGGGGLFSGDTESEAETVRRFMVGFGISEDRLVLEQDSRNTAENAAFTKAALADADGAIVLVTSAFHMPRSVGLYRAAGVDVVPWPTDYRSTGMQGLALDLANPNQNLDTATTAIREWIGLLAYFATGQIGDLFPSP
ncbi:YdcF family protein [Devosia faecipullorum]|uniref:YdcF family protein n=1 Tax=Devosia faecipullorum TaxID=2755039 RepID=UPI00187B78C1|nr:YdcF family protein [Devosia faecipullorum]MBE7732508.1 YdcF family protein [Devosia faecipullorum]